MNGFADRLIHVREQAGVSQTALGELCDMAGTQISRYEAGRATPRRATIKRIANALHVSPEWLATGEGAPGQFFVTLDVQPNMTRPVLKADPEIERKFFALAAKEGLAPEDFLRKLVIDHLENLESKPTKLEEIADRLTKLEEAIGKNHK